MNAPSGAPLTITTLIRQPLDRVWQLYTLPEHIVQWNFATSDWYCPSAVNDLREGGEFNWRMESKDGRMGFDLKGTYTEVTPGEMIAYRLEDGRRSVVKFDEEEGNSRVTVSFEAEKDNPADLQRNGWQAILDNFCRYAEQRG